MDDSLENQLKSEFLQEASQILDETESSFLGLEAGSDPASALDRIFRMAHNLKGTSRAVGLESVGELTHELENLLVKLKSGEVAVSAGIVTLLLACNDQLRT